MAKRPIYHAEFGQYLVSLREAKGRKMGRDWSQSDVERVAQKRGLPLTRQVLLNLEAGRTKNPKPDVLRAVAALYDVTYDDLATRFVARRFDLALSDLPRHDPAVKPLREVQANAQAELRQLRAEYDSLRRKVQDIGEALFGVLLDHPEKPAQVSGKRGKRTGTEGHSRPRGEPPG